MNSFQILALFAVISAFECLPLNVSVILKPELRAEVLKREYPNTNICQYEKKTVKGFIPETTIEASCRDLVSSEEDLFGQCYCAEVKTKFLGLRLVAENTYEETEIESSTGCELKCDVGSPAYMGTLSVR